MLQLLELMPLVIFVLVFGLKDQTVSMAGLQHTFDGIYDATAALMIATVLQVLLVWLLKRHVEKRLWWLLAAVLIFGSATLILHNQLFIQWKPTIFNWALCLVLLGSHYFTKQNLVERILDKQIQLPTIMYKRITFIWAAYFFIVGALNLVVAYSFSEAFWVQYKLYSAIGFTVLMTIITTILLAPYIKDASMPDTTTEENTGK
jgi:intracellular septation protein